MEELVERELTVPDAVDDVWRSLAEPEWLERFSIRREKSA